MLNPRPIVQLVSRDPSTPNIPLPNTDLVLHAQLYRANDLEDMLDYHEDQVTPYLAGNIVASLSAATDEEGGNVWAFVFEEMGVIVEEGEYRLEFVLYESIG